MHSDQIMYGISDSMIQALYYDIRTYVVGTKVIIRDCIMDLEMPHIICMVTMHQMSGVS